MGLKISNNLLKKMNEDNVPRLKLSNNFHKMVIQRENADMLKNGFMVGGDLIKEELDISKMTFEQIKQYVLEHTVKVKSRYELVAEAGAIVVPFSEFVKMVNDGYEIYKSEVLNENLISIEFQKEMKRDKSR